MQEEIGRWALLYVFPSLAFLVVILWNRHKATLERLHWTERQFDLMQQAYEQWKAKADDLEHDLSEVNEELSEMYQRRHHEEGEEWKDE